jgi:hypothetical protein
LMRAENAHRIGQAVSLPRSLERVAEPRINDGATAPHVGDGRALPITYIFLAVLIALACGIGVAVFGISVLRPVLV